jgi:ubiquinone/menaquinone biosynthesis C-methylase UbiE
MENPERLLGDHVRSGMTVLEPGCALGYFTLPLARMVGPEGRVVVLEVQSRMLEGLERRARRAGLLDRIDRRLIDGHGLELDDLAGTVDFAAAIHMVHAVPDRAEFFTGMRTALKPGARLLVREPRGHVKAVDFEATLDAARTAGFQVAEQGGNLGARGALLIKADHE